MIIVRAARRDYRGAGTVGGGTRPLGDDFVTPATYPNDLSTGQLSPYRIAMSVTGLRAVSSKPARSS